MLKPNSRWYHGSISAATEIECLWVRDMRESERAKVKRKAGERDSESQTKYFNTFPSTFQSTQLNTSRAIIDRLMRTVYTAYMHIYIYIYISYISNTFMHSYG